jgi:hypothetical protein
MAEHVTLYLNTFRREPAIAKFVWPFTPYHRSSPPFSTDVCSVLHRVLPPLQPAHGKITWLRVYSMRLKRPIQTRFRSGSPSLVNLATHRNSQAHSSKGTPSRPAYADDALTVCKPTVSGTISLPSRGTFHLSLTVLVHYRSSTILRLTRWSSQIHASLLGPGVTWDT